MAAHEHGLPAGEEEQRVVPLGQLDEVEHRARLRGVATRLPNLHASEGAEHGVSRRRHAGRDVTGRVPIPERLLPVTLEAHRLHPDDAVPRPEHVEEAAGLRLLEARAEPHLVGALRQADAELADLHRRLMQGAFWVVPKNEQLALSPSRRAVIGGDDDSPPAGALLRPLERLRRRGAQRGATFLNDLLARYGTNRSRAVAAAR